MYYSSINGGIYTETYNDQGPAGCWFQQSHIDPTLIWYYYNDIDTNDNNIIQTCQPNYHRVSGCVCNRIGKLYISTMLLDF